MLLTDETIVANMFALDSDEHSDGLRDFSLYYMEHLDVSEKDVGKLHAKQAKLTDMGFSRASQ